MFNKILNVSNEILLVCLSEFFLILTIVSSTSILALFMSEFLNLNIAFSFFIVGAMNFATACISILSSELSDNFIGIEKTISYGYFFEILGILCYVCSNYLNSDFSIYIFYIGLIFNALGIGFIEVHLYSLIKLFTKKNEYANNYVLLNIACICANVIAPLIMGIVLNRGQTLSFGDCFFAELVFIVLSLVSFITLKTKYSIRDNYKTKVKRSNIKLDNTILKYVLFLSFMNSLGCISSFMSSTSNLYLVKDFANSFISIGSLNLFMAPQTYISIGMFTTLIVLGVFWYYKNRFKKMHNLFNYYIVGIILFLMAGFSLLYVGYLIDLGYSDINPFLFIPCFVIGGMSYPFIASISWSFMGKIVPKSHISKCFAILLFIQGIVALIANYLTGLYPINGINYLFGFIPISDFKSFMLIFVILFAFVLVFILLVKFKTRNKDGEFYLI